VAIPILSFEAEILSDAPFEVVNARLREPDALKCLRPFGPWSLIEEDGRVRLNWTRRRLASHEEGTLSLSPHERGVHLHLEARHRGWMAFGTFGILRWHSDRLLERLVEEL
jgi:hypothetical protein